jgi:hypothetical protein
MNIKELRLEILELHKKEINAHWNKDIDFFVSDISQNYMSVAGEDAHRPSREEIRSQFSTYLNNTTFTKYEDVFEPIIGFSKDGSLAWVILQIKVEGQRMMEEGAEVELDFTCAWITLYEREDDRWIRLVDVSTFK